MPLHLVVVAGQLRWMLMDGTPVPVVQVYHIEYCSTRFLYSHSIRSCVGLFIIIPCSDEK